MYYLYTVFLRNSYRSDHKINYMADRIDGVWPGRVYFLFYLGAQCSDTRTQNYHTYNRGSHAVLLTTQLITTTTTSPLLQCCWCRHTPEDCEFNLVILVCTCYYFTITEQNSFKLTR